MFEGIFFLCLALLLYTYVGYPLLLWAFQFRAKEPFEPTEPGEWPSVSILIAAHNEESCIGERLRNLQSLNYPGEKLQVLLGSDGSTDQTVALAKEASFPGLTLFDFPQRTGKAGVLNRLARSAEAEYLVFSDANSFWDPEALQILMLGLQEEGTGGVTGRLILRAADSVTANPEKDYWNLENQIKAWESQLGTTLGATGAIYAIHRELWQPLPLDRPLMDDFIIGCRVVLSGQRFRFEPRALAWEVASSSIHSEMQRKRRIFEANFQGVPLLWSLLRLNLAGWIYVSRKLLRWLSPFWLLGLHLGSLGSEWTWWVLIAIAGQAALYGAALLHPFAQVRGWHSPLLTLPYYFLRLQWELLRAFFRVLFSPSRQALWERSERFPKGSMTSGPTSVEMPIH